MAHLRIFNHYVHTPLVFLGVLDVLCLFAAAYGSVYIRFWDSPGDQYLALQSLLPKAATFSFVMLLSMLAMGVYQARFREGMLGMFLRTAVSFCLLGSIALSLVYYVFPALFLGRGLLAIAIVIALFLTGIVQAIFYRIVEESRLQRRVLIIGAGEKALDLEQRLTAAGGKGIQVVGYVAIEAQHGIVVPEDRCVSTPDGLLLKARDLSVDEIIVAADERRRDAGGGIPLDELLECKLSGIPVTEALCFYERELGILELGLLRAGWMIYADGFQRSSLKEYSKGAFDFLVSGLLLLVASPIMLLTMLAIKLEDGWKQPVFYRQARVGLDGRPFQVLKFRSMITDAEKNGAVWAQKNDARVTRVGAFIRNTRIDELPQIFNVFRGQMSFVGPRPERPEFVKELAQKIPYYDERHRIKPGIAGWAQLCYPYGASDEDAAEKLRYDLYYVKNHSLFLDILIIIQTVEIILVGRGVR